MIAAWHKVCKTELQGVLGIRHVRAINNAALLKLSRDFISFDNQWSCFLSIVIWLNATQIVLQRVLQVLLPVVAFLGTLV